jgi:hypothetical protein
VPSRRPQTAHQVARQKLTLRKEQYDMWTEPFKLDVGQQVLLYDETVRRGRSKELTVSPQYMGPYEVLSGNGVKATVKKGALYRLEPFC